MSNEEAIAHWRTGAREALRWAERMAEEESRALAMFHCHLAVEKALKALYMERTGEPAPYTHSLTHLASLLDVPWSGDELRKFQELTPFASQARYDDLGWVEEQATPELLARWLMHAKELLPRLGCALEA